MTNDTSFITAQPASPATTLNDAQVAAQEVGTNITYLPNGDIRFTKPGVFDITSRRLAKMNKRTYRQVRSTMTDESMTAEARDDLMWSIAQSMLTDQTVDLDDVLQIEDMQYYLATIFNDGVMPTEEDVEADAHPLVQTEG